VLPARFFAIDGAASEKLVEAKQMTSFLPHLPHCNSRLLIALVVWRKPPMSTSLRAKQVSDVYELLTRFWFADNLDSQRLKNSGGAEATWVSRHVPMMP
jgi:hypothetical protein